VAVLAAVPVLLLAYIWLFMVRMPGRSYAAALPPLQPEEATLQRELERHVRRLSADIGERSDITAAAVARAAEYLERELRDAGYVVGSQPFEVGGRTYRNLEASLPGRGLADQIVVVGGHYDTVADAPGANDNASGTAAVLALARSFAAQPLSRTVRWVLFANEEPPFFDTDKMGSRFYAARAARAGDRIVAMISLETIGYYSDQPGSQRYPFPFSLFYPDRGDFVGFVSDLASGPLVRRSLAAFRRRVAFPSQGVAAPAWIPGVFWSDHASFWIHGYPAIMITDTAFFRYPHYHTPEDTPDKPDYARMARVVAGVAHVVRDLGGDTP
jgi:Zn-dependent M28 family amino/carboxypeptidase